MIEKTSELFVNIEKQLEQIEIIVKRHSATTEEAIESIESQIVSVINLASSIGNIHKLSENIQNTINTND